MSFDVISLCYGYAIDSADMAKMIGASKQIMDNCAFCNRPSSDEGAKFCAGCGHGLEVDAGELKTMDVVELVLKTGGDPPQGIRVVGAGNKVCICHEICEGDDLAIAEKPMEHFPWRRMADLLESYIEMVCVSCPAAKPSLFAIRVRA